MRQLPPSIMEKINKQNQTIYENAPPNDVAYSKGYNCNGLRLIGL